MRFITGWIGCALGRHERSEPDVRVVDSVYYSRCRTCGVPMRRRAKRDWVVDRNAPKPPSGS